MFTVREKLAAKTLRLLTAGMAKPRVTASALKALQLRPKREQRELLNSLHGYECSWCACRFPESAIRDGVTLFEKRHLAKVQRDLEFSEHVCSDAPTHKAK
jgi:hypothetical protein